jgi:non-canonical (house-cleaning) NTP pyrophosphatase
MTTLGLASSSDLARQVVENAVAKISGQPGLLPARIVCFAAASDVSEQPVGERFGVAGARNRIANGALLAAQQAERVDYWIAIENFIEPVAGDEHFWADRAAVVACAASMDNKAIEFGLPARFDVTFAMRARQKSLQVDKSGWSHTVGDVIHDEFPRIPPDDWHRDARFGGVTRAALMEQAVLAALQKAGFRG